jgi:hypothetical protein
MRLRRPTLSGGTTETTEDVAEAATLRRRRTLRRLLCATTAAELAEQFSKPAEIAAARRRTTPLRLAALLLHDLAEQVAEAAEPTLRLRCGLLRRPLHHHLDQALGIEHGGYSWCKDRRPRLSAQHRGAQTPLQ